MLATDRSMGNSQGVPIPKPLMQQVGLVEQAERLVEGDALLLRSPKAKPRNGWAEASKELAARGDALVMPEFGNENDVELSW